MTRVAMHKVHSLYDLDVVRAETIEALLRCVVVGHAAPACVDWVVLTEKDGSLKIRDETAMGALVWRHEP